MLLSFAWSAHSLAQESTPEATDVPAATAVPEAAAVPEATAVPKSTAHDDHGHGHGGAGAGGAGAAAGPSLGSQLPLWLILPFVALLGCIAVLPLTAHHWWESNTNKGIISGVLAALTAGVLLVHYGQAAQHKLFEALVIEYVGFVLLLGALYVISGGIYIRGSLAGTTLSNTILMAIGAVLASIIGTTGASVVLIRPLLRANATRKAKAHIVVFFIFVVSNCGGLLTPLGDPPLFMGFQKGVPFLWTLEHLWLQWFFVNAVLLFVFMIYDMMVFDREEKAREGSQLEEVMKHEPLGIDGQLNILFLVGVVIAIFMKGQLTDWFHHHWPLPHGLGALESALIVLTLAAYFTTPAINREKNNFTFGPIIEVAVLFAGIFVTMVPALEILNAWGSHERTIAGIGCGLTEPWQYFWVTGGLSSVLDNAPTYLTMCSTAAGGYGLPAEGAYLSQFLAHQPVGDAIKLLSAISCGAVFMGANTYIGNGPNFMVKAIAEENGVHMPSFFGYMFYSGGILIPIFIAATLIFFRG